MASLIGLLNLLVLNKFLVLSISKILLMKRQNLIIAITLAVLNHSNNNQ